MVFAFNFLWSQHNCSVPSFFPTATTGDENSEWLLVILCLFSRSSTYVLILGRVDVVKSYMLLGMGCYLSTWSSSCYGKYCLYQCHLLQVPQIPLLTWLLLSLSLSDVVDPDRSMVLTTLCWCSTVGFVWCYPWFFQYLIWGVTVALLMDGCLHEVDCLTCDGITDLTSLITPTLVFLRNTISCLDWFTTGTWK